MREVIYRSKRIFYMLLAVVGVPVNLVAIVILARRKCGLSICTIRYMVAMSTADLMFIVIDVVLFRISYYYFPRSVLDITPVCSLLYAWTHSAMDCSVWFTIAFSIDRYVAICCQALKAKYCNEKTAAVVLVTASILLSLKNVPFYFTKEPGEIIDNVPWLCYKKPSYYTAPVWVGFDWFDKILTPLLPFTLILLLNALTVRHILVANQIRKRLKGQTKRENHSDTEMESRRRSVILLFAISGSFILLWFTYVIDFLYYSIAGINPRYYNDSLYIFGQVGFMLRNLCCCINTFIYGVTQAKFRDNLRSVMQLPLQLTMQLINKSNEKVQLTAI